MLAFIKNISIEELFNLSLKFIINTLLVFIIIVLILGLAKTVYSINGLIPIENFANGFNHNYYRNTLFSGNLGTL